MLRLVGNAFEPYESLKIFVTAYVRELEEITKSYYFPAIPEDDFERLLNYTNFLRGEDAWTDVKYAYDLQVEIVKTFQRLSQRYSFQHLEWCLRKRSSLLRLIIVSKDKRNHLYLCVVPMDSYYHHLQRIGGYTKNFENLDKFYRQTSAMRNQCNLERAQSGKPTVQQSQQSSI